MSMTASNMLPLGSAAPSFILPNVVDGQPVSYPTAAKTTVILFICNHCPFVKHILPTLISFAKTYQQKNIDFIAISSNDVVNYPDDAPHLMKKLAETLQFSFPYLYDETQTIAKAYQAACTPDIFVFDETHRCVYRGQFDGARPGNEVAVTGEDLAAALDALLNHQPIDPDQKPSIGCNIKWKR